LCCMGLVQAMRLPGLFPRLHNDGREIPAELVSMDLEPTVLGLLESEGEGVEFLGRPQPDEAAFAHVYVRLEDLFFVFAGAAVSSRRRDQQGPVPQIGDYPGLLPEAL